MNLILIEPEELGELGRVSISGARAAHIHGVLRAAAGDTLRVGVINGPRGSAVVVSATADQALLACTWEPGSPAVPRVDLLLALPRPKVMRRLWAQLAALGAGRIFLTNAARVERQYFDTHVVSPETYRPLLVEGLQQARDTRLPDVSVHRQLKILIEDHLDRLCPGAVRIVAEPGASATVRDAVASVGHARVLVAIGPEGGWNTYERTLFDRHGFTAVGMGERPLRTDTACVALLALVHAGLAEHAT